MSLIRNGGVRRGTIAVGDIGTSTGARTVTGDLTSATQTTPGAGQSQVVVVFPTMPSPPDVAIGIESAGTPATDNQMSPVVFHTVTATGLTLFLEETAAVAGDILVHLTLTPSG